MAPNVSNFRARTNTLQALVGLALAGAIVAVWLDIVAVIAGWR